MLMAQLQQAATNVRDITNTVRSCANNSDILLMAGTATNRSIVIGSGTDPVAITDYKLGTQITTNVAHGASTFATSAPTAKTFRLEITRIFANNTGATLNVNECGLYACSGNQGYFYCVDRTLYTAVVLSTYHLTMTYRLTTSVP